MQVLNISQTNIRASFCVSQVNISIFIVSVKQWEIDIAFQLKALSTESFITPVTHTVIYTYYFLPVVHTHTPVDAYILSVQWLKL